MTIHLSDGDKHAIARARAVAQAHESGGALAAARLTDPELPEGSPLAYPMAYGAAMWQLGSLLAVLDAHADPEAGS
jgi:hypothetical protein